MYSFKTLIFAFLAVVTMILIGGYFTYKTQLNAIINDSYHDLEAIKNLKVKQIIDWRKERIGDANAILSNSLITDELKAYIEYKDISEEQKILDWFHSLQISYGYQEIILTDNNLKPILSSNQESKYKTHHFQEFMNKSGEKGVYISPIHRDSLNALHYSIKIELKDSGNELGYLIIIVDPNNFLYPLIQEWPTLSKTAETLLVKKDGDSLIFINQLRHFNNTALSLKQPLTNTNLPATMAVKGYEGMFRGYDYRGVKVLSSVGPVPGTDWFIISKVDEDEILERPSRYLVYGIIIVTLMIILSYLFFSHLWRITQNRALRKELELKKDKLRMTNLYATLSQINQAIVREQSRSELILQLPKLPVTYGNFAASSISIIDEQDGHLKVEAFQGAISYFHSILRDNSTYRIDEPSVFAVTKNQTSVYNTLSDDEWMKEAVKANILSCASSPINFYDKTIGSFSIYSQEEFSFKDEEVKLLEEIASDISFALETIDRNEKHRIAEQKVIENERKLATLFSNLPGIAYRCFYNKEWTMEFMSEGSLIVTGYHPHEIINNNVIAYNDLIVSDDREYVWNKVSQAVNQKSSFTINYRINSKDGKQRWVWERGQPVYNTEGKAIALEGFISDITELREAQYRLIRSEEYFRYLFHNNPLPMWIYDLESYKFIDVNEVATNRYGYSRSEFLSMNLFNIRPEEEFTKLKDNLSKRRTIASYSGEWVHKLKNGKLIDVYIFSHEIEYEEKPAVLVVSIDITARKKAENELIEAKEKAEASEKIKTDFLAQMSHEIRTPVNVILSFSSMIKDAVYESIEEDLKEGFLAIDNAGHRLIRTIDSILNMAQLTSGVFEVTPEELDLHKDILTSLQREFKSLAQVKKLEFTLDNNCEDTTVFGDYYSLSQIFANLIDNAIKYTDKGYVKIYTKCEDSFVSVSIKDSGIGINKEYQENLFHPFSQEETGYSRRYEGTGLGLALVDHYCRLNNAEIKVESEKHQGSTFTVFIPKKSHIEK